MKDPDGRLVVSVSLFSMHVVTVGELQFTLYVPRCVLPSDRMNVTGSLPPPTLWSVIVVPVSPAPFDAIDWQFVVAGVTSEITRPLCVLAANVTGLSSFTWPLATMTSVWSGTVANGVPSAASSSIEMSYVLATSCVVLELFAQENVAATMLPLARLRSRSTTLCAFT
jgi:hypothetical protein